MACKLRSYLFLFMLLFSPGLLHAQEEIRQQVDSLINLLEEAKDKERLSILTMIVDEARDTDPQISIEYADYALSLARRLKDDEQYIEILLLLGDAYNNARDRESALKTYEQAIEKSEDADYRRGKAEALNNIARVYSDNRDYEEALEYANQSIELSRDIKNEKIMGDALSVKGNILRWMGRNDEAIEIFTQALEIAGRLNDKSSIGRVNLGLGQIYYNRGKFLTAIDYFRNARQIREEINDPYGAAVALTNMANSYFYLAEYDNALKAYRDAIIFWERVNRPENAVICLSGIAAIYDVLQQYKNAAETNEHILEISIELQDSVKIADTYNNMSILYSKIARDSIAEVYKINLEDTILSESTDKFLKYYDRALEYINKALDIREKINNTKGITAALSVLSSIYVDAGKPKMALEYNQRVLELSRENNILHEEAMSLLRMGNIYMVRKQYQQALKYFQEGSQLASELGLRETVQDSYLKMSSLYQRLGDYEKALELYKQHISLKDSITSENIRKQLNELAVQYETEAKERENELLRTKNDLSEIRLRQQRYALIFFTIVTLIILILVVLLIRQNNQRKKANRELAQKNALITEQKKEITDSIQYAKRIQMAILPPNELMDRLLPEQFIIYMPRDIVSGDYYWVTEKNGKVITVAADCTGHGVPGAFMSMLGIAFLNEIVSKHNDIPANEILNELRDHVIKSLHQTGRMGESQDGMDVALHIFDRKNMTLEYSGANNPLFIFRDGQLMETKADKMPIGIHTNADQAFQNHLLKVQKNDVIYTFSDGYPDQFGGPIQKKFMIKNFKQLLKQIHLKPMQEQKEILERTLHEWMSETEQVDDILVIGVRI